VLQEFGDQGPGGRSYWPHRRDRADLAARQDTVVRARRPAGLLNNTPIGTATRHQRPLAVLGLNQNLARSTGTPSALFTVASAMSALRR